MTVLDTPGGGDLVVAPRRARATRRPASAATGALVAAGIAVGVASLVPAGYLVIRASEAGVARMADVATDARTLGLLVRTSGLAIAVTTACVAIAVPVAWLTVRTDLPGRRAVAVLTALPLAIPTYVGGYAFVAALGPKGVFQGWLEPLGVDRLPSIYGFPGAFLALTLFSYPYVLLTVRAALRRLDPSLEEASRSLGRGRFTTFVRITLPQLRPAIVAGSLLVALYSLSDFGAVSLLRFDSFTRVIYTQYRGSLDRSAAAVLGLVLMALTLVILTAELRTRGSAAYHRLHAGGARATATVPLGRWRWVAFAGCALLVTAALVVPVGIISYWLARGTSSGETLQLTIRLVGNSLQASALGAIVSLVAAWPVAVLSVRRPGFVASLVERSTYIGFALPGVVVALSLVFFGARVVPAVYQTRALLVFAYVVLFLPQAVGALRTSLLQVSPSLEEASRLLGATPAATARRVVLPLVRPGALAGFALVFLTCMKELPATLLLAPTGFQTLATQVWGATSEAFFSRAAAPALALVVLSAIPMLLLTSGEERR